MEQSKTPLAEIERTSGFARLGWALLVASVLCWVPLPILPFVPIETESQITYAGVLVVSAEVAFWSGAALAGPEAARRMRSWWRRNPKPQD